MLLIVDLYQRFQIYYISDILKEKKIIYMYIYEIFRKFLRKKKRILKAIYFERKFAIFIKYKASYTILNLELIQAAFFLLSMHHRQKKNH